MIVSKKDDEGGTKEEIAKMLPAYIIEEILRWERDKSTSSRDVFLEYPLYDDNFEPFSENTTDDQSEESGIAIIDFTI